MMSLLLAALADAAIVLTLGLIASLLLRRRSAALRHAVLAMAIATASMMPVFEALIPQMPVIRWQTPATVVSAGLTFGAGETKAGSVIESGATSPWERVSWPMVFVGVWGLGAMLTGAGLIAGFVRLARLTRRCRPIEGRWRELTDELARECGVRRRVALLQSDDRSLLITFGVLAPTIVLPDDSSEWTDDRRRIVLRHELAHVKRHDAAIQIAGEILRVVQWLNPFVWIACRRLRQESEYACDDAVLSGGVAATEYATHLLDVAKYLTGRSVTPAHAIVHPSTLERRIVAMLHQHRNRAPLGRRGWAAAALVALGVSVPLAAAAIAPEEPRVPAVAESIDLSVPASTSASPAITTLPARAAAPVPPTSARPEPATVIQSTGTLVGTLLDPSGGSLPGAQLTLTDTQAGTGWTSESDASGRFAFRDLPPARYELVARLPGFAAVSNVLTVGSGATVRRTITLPLGTLQETITVGCGTPSASASTARAIRSIIASAFPVLSAQDAPVRVGGQIRPPMKTKDVKPACPPLVPALETTVRLTGRIGVDGLMNDVKQVPAQPGAEVPAEFLESAIEAVRQWTFTPTQLNGQPVDVAITVTVTFRRQ